MTEREALKLALEFVASISPAFICEATHHKKNERHSGNEPCPHVAKQKATYEAIKEALMSVPDGAQTEQEPVAWIDLQKEAQQIVESKVLWKRFIDGTPLANDIACWMADFAQYHTTPSQREPLTDEEIDELSHSMVRGDKSVNWLCRAIERKHGIYAPTERKGEA